MFLNQKAKAENEPLSFAHAKNFLTSLLFFLTFLFLPTQFGLHTWPFFSFVSGQRLDYLSPTFYLTDIFLFLLFLFHTKHLIKSIKWYYFPLILFLSIGITFSINPFAGWWWLLKLLEFFFLGWLITSQQIGISRVLLCTFSIGISFESILGTVQYLHQGSINGLFYFFGERFYTASTPGIANASINGSLVLRPYGTFSHPNVLAGYLLVGLLFLLITLLFQSFTKRQFFLLIPLILGTGGLFISLSRAAILLWIFSFFTLLLIRFHRQKKLLIAASSLFVLLLIFSIPTVIRGRFAALLTDGEDVSLRVSLLQAALHMLFSHPFFGVGLHNFLSSLPFYSPQTSFLSLQPVHNIFLLVASETGFPGFVIFCLFFFHALWFAWKKKTKPVFLWSFVSLLVIFLVGQIDHYFLTLQQGQLLFTLVAATAYRKTT